MKKIFEPCGSEHINGGVIGNFNQKKEIKWLK